MSNKEERSKPYTPYIFNYYGRMLRSPLFRWVMVVYVVVIASFTGTSYFMRLSRDASDPVNPAVEEAVSDVEEKIEQVNARVTALEAAQPIDLDKLDAVIKEIEKFESLTTTDAALVVEQIAAVKSQVADLNL